MIAEDRLWIMSHKCIRKEPTESVQSKLAYRQPYGRMQLTEDMHAQTDRHITANMTLYRKALRLFQYRAEIKRPLSQ